jgi:hypothetical protein
MTTGDRIVVVCPDCGATARAGETACFLCGKRLGVADAKKTIGLAADSPSASLPTFHISSLLLLIALVALCLGVGHDEPVLGIALAVVVLPAAAYTTIIAFRSAALGKPMAVFEKVWSFLAAISGVVVIALAALIAFCVTCIPAGFVAMSGGGETGIIVAVVIGGIAAVAAGAFMTRFLLTRKRRIARKAGEP